MDRWDPPALWGLPDVGERVWLPRGIVIPWLDGGEVREIKIRRPIDKPKYVRIRGGCPILFVAGALDHRRIVVPVEGELDALLLAQECGDLVAAVTLGSASNYPSGEAVDRLLGARAILLLCDNDEAGQQAPTRWAALRARVTVLALPFGKDVTEMHQHGGDLREWLTIKLELLGLAPSRSVLLPPLVPPSIDDVFGLLGDRDVTPTVEAGDRLVLNGPELAADDPLSLGIDRHRAALIELFRPPASYDPTRQAPPRPWACALNTCTEMIPDEELVYCPPHRQMADDGTLWDAKAAPDAQATADDETATTPSAPVPAFLREPARTSSLPLAPAHHHAWWTRPGYRPPPGAD